jgi:GNAT superfamily N-acetyltransferase
MNIIRLKTISDTYFSEAWELYLEAFPPQERKTFEAQTRLMKNSKYHYDILVDENQLIGFLLWWDLDTIRYIDHFATDKEQRNKGYGKLILKEFITRNDKPVILEVELPESSMNERRIKFYERTGFKLNHHQYQLPFFKEGDPAIQFLLMTYPELISEEDVELFVKNCHPIIFKD